MQITPSTISKYIANSNSFSFFLAFRGLSGLCWLCAQLAGLHLAALFGGSVGGAIQDVLRVLQSLKMLPGAQQGGVVNQCVHQLPARANPLTAVRLAWLVLLNP